MEEIIEELLTGVYSSIIFVFGLFFYVYLMVLAFKKHKTNHSFSVGMFAIYIMHFLGQMLSILLSDIFVTSFSIEGFFMSFGFMALSALFFMAFNALVRHVVERT